MNLKRFTALKQKAEDAQREADKAQGALDQLKERLKKEFQCCSLKDAESLLRNLEKEEKEAEREFDKALAEFEDKFGSVLEE